MLRALDPLRFVLIAVAGWMNQDQQQMIDYLREENRVLREQLGGDGGQQRQHVGADDHHAQRRFTTIFPL